MQNFNNRLDFMNVIAWHEYCGASLADFGPRILVDAFQTSEWKN